MTTRHGYALPLTLAAIIVIALVAAMAAEQVRSSTRTVTQLVDQMRSRTEMVSAEQTLIYTLLTEPMTMNGISMGGQSDITSLVLGTGDLQNATDVIRANGQAYRYGEGSVVARIYDDQAFLNISSSDPAYLSDILYLYDIPRAQHARLIASLRDYQDEDDLRTLGGAEASDYELDGYPTNQPLRDVLEVCAVMHWSDTPVCEDRGRLLLTARTRSSDRINPRLVSEAMLALMRPELDRDAVNDTYAMFAQQQLTAFDQIDQGRFDVVRDPLSTLTAPGPYLTLITQTPDASVVRRTVIELTPESLISPFVVHSKYAIGGDYSQNILRIESIDDVAPLPQTPSLASER